MQRLHQQLFVVSLVGLCWLGMMAVHELGHVLGALMTGGGVERVVLHPLAISRTEVAPNPRPAIVVWAGPLVGCLLPLGIFAVIPRRYVVTRNVARFFAGFCLVANGAYIAGGSFQGIGDCGEMLRTGTPRWVMWVFGVVAFALGIYLWHGMGSLGEFFRNPGVVSRRVVYGTLVVFIAVVVLGLVFSPW